MYKFKRDNGVHKAIDTNSQQRLLTLHLKTNLPLVRQKTGCQLRLAGLPFQYICVFLYITVIISFVKKVKSNRKRTECSVETITILATSNLAC